MGLHNLTSPQFWFDLCSKSVENFNILSTALVVLKDVRSAAASALATVKPAQAVVTGREASKAHFKRADKLQISSFAASIRLATAILRMAEASAHTVQSG